MSEIALNLSAARDAAANAQLFISKAQSIPTIDGGVSRAVIGLAAYHTTEALRLLNETLPKGATIGVSGEAAK